MAERQNHAREVMRTFDVTTIHGIVISSGDGLLYEVSWEGMHLHICTCTVCGNDCTMYTCMCEACL